MFLSVKMLRVIVWFTFVFWLEKFPGCQARYRFPQREPRVFTSVVGKYASYIETMNWYNRLQRGNPDLVKLIPIGMSYQGRVQMVMRISPIPEDIYPAIFIEGGMHAREWLSPSSVNYVIEEMIQGYRKRKVWYRRAFQKYIFYFMSITNPDGYVFSFDKSSSKNRFWRKNRRMNFNGCPGVDLNRNWNIAFGGRGTSAGECDDIYRGKHAFSEPETDNIRQFALRRLSRNNRRPGLQLYISMHTFGQTFIVPYSYTKERPSQDYELHRAALVASEAIRKATGATYAVKNGAQRFGITTSGSDDWMLAKMKAPYSYTLELRPGDPSNYQNGGLELFVQPTSQIIPTGKDALAGLKGLVDTMKSLS